MLQASAIQPQRVEKLQQHYKISALGSELTGSLQRARFRLSLANYQPNHIYFISQLVKRFPGYVKEISLNLRDTDAIFTASGQHNYYLQQAGILAQAKEKKRLRRSVFERLKPQKVDRDVYPKNAATHGASQQAKEKSRNQQEERKTARFAQAIDTLLKTIAESLPDMENLEVLAFYGIRGAQWVGAMCEGMQICSARYKSLRMAAFCDLCDEALGNRVLQAARACLSLKVLAVQNCGLSSALGGKLVASLIRAHQNEREQLLWQKTLRDDHLAVESRSQSRGTPRFRSPSRGCGKSRALSRSSSAGRSISREKNSPKFMRCEIQEYKLREQLLGLKFLDLSYNGLNNCFLEEIGPDLQTDKYITGLDLQGNNFAQSARQFKKTHEFDDFFDIDEELDEVYCKNGRYIPLDVALNKFVLQEHARHNLNPFERFLLKNIAPNPNIPANMQLASLFANYSRSTRDLEFLQAHNCHPLVELVIRNYTLDTILLDEKIAQVMRAFVNFKLELNRQAKERLIPRITDQIAEITLFEAHTTKKLERSNVSGMASKLAQAEDYLAYASQRRSRSVQQLGFGFRKAPRIPAMEERYARDFKVEQVAAVSGKKTKKPILESQARLKNLETGVKTKSKQLTSSLTDLRQQVESQQKQVDKMLSAMNESKSIAQRLGDQLHLQKYPRVSKIVQDHDDKGPAEERPLENNQFSLRSSSSDSSLFNQVLDATYQYLMEKYQDDKAMALRCFEENQDTILECCQQAMRAEASDSQLDTRIYELLDQAFQ